MSNQLIQPQAETIEKMAKLFFKESSKEVEIKDGEPIKAACEQAGVLFGCEDGYCGTCRVEISLGEENLREKNSEEKALTGNNPKLRLACQCKAKSGLIEIGNY